MQTITEFLGFTTLAGSIWNAISYAAFIGIIIGISWERGRNALFTFGASALALYAGFFLHDILFTTLQILITISALMQWTKVSGYFAGIAMTVLTVAAYLFLISRGAIADIWSLAGSLGLLGIAFGILVLNSNSGRKRYGFLIMAAGGTLLVLYALHVKAWVFFFLNIFFAIANIRGWLKQDAKQLPVIAYKPMFSSGMYVCDGCGGLGNLPGNIAHLRECPHYPSEGNRRIDKALKTIDKL